MHELIDRRARCEPIVGGQRVGNDPEGDDMAFLVGADALERGPLVVGPGELDQAVIGELGRRLECHVERAVTLKRLVPQLGFERGRYSTRRAGHGDEQSRRPRTERGGARVEMVLGRRHPTRQRALDLAAVHDECRSQPALLQQEPAQVLGVELLVLPDPHEGLAQQRAHVGIQVERVDASGDGFFAVRDGNDLFAFEGQEPELLALEVGPTGVFDLPPLDELPDLVQELRLEVGHRVILPCGYVRSCCISPVTVCQS